MEAERIVDARFGLLASIGWNGSFDGDRKDASDFFPSLRILKTAHARVPRTREEARRLAPARAADMLARMKQTIGQR